MKPRSLLHPITERKSDICAALSSSARPPNNHPLYWNLPPPRKRVWSNSSKNSPLSIMYIRVVSRASNFPRLLLFEKMHQPRRKLLIRLHDFHRGISKAWGGRRRITAGDLRSPIAGETDLLASSSREKFRRDAILRSADREEECDWFGHRAFYYLER